ncbi:MAG TPA: aspartate carbamoyltransferase catalytic subunit [Planctomycetota bacterium]|nr:aspartate carbamoyltransferase catalytic subunit [Planctomycetota bacterium]
MEASAASRARRHLVTIDDLSTDEIRELFGIADRISKEPRAVATTCGGQILASLFYEPSTRTRLSFESAMQRLGGGVISAADMRSSSAAKGESLADTVRVVGAYADVLVIRHPKEGAARVAERYATVPVVNAGDGSHEHPTQTLCDLYSLHAEKGRIEGLDVVLCGDLKYSRTIHSFAFALARFGANLVCAPQPGFEMPDYVIHRLREDFHVEPHRVEVRDLENVAPRMDAMYFTPERPHQLSLFTDVRSVNVKKFDALYVTRPQRERYSPQEQQTPAPYFRVDRASLAGARFRETVVLHPLPRVDELSYDLDEDPRSVYFQQAARGVPMRMAVIGVLLGHFPLQAPPPAAAARTTLRTRGALECANPGCVTHAERQYLPSEFVLASREPLRVRCAFCDAEPAVPYVGCASTRHFHLVASGEIARIKTENLVLFASAAEATAAGFAPAATRGSGAASTPA